MQEKFRPRSLMTVCPDDHQPEHLPEPISTIQVALSYLRFCNSGRMKFLKTVSRIACALRAFRAVFFLGSHKTLFGLKVFSEFVVPQVDNDLFHHLSRRHYLAKNLRSRQRVECVLSHYRFEERSFDINYKKAVYSQGGLVLWQRTVDGTDFLIRLTLADRYAAEGDLCVSLMVDEVRLHAIAFSWIPGSMVQEHGCAIFVALNQGRLQKEHEYHHKFAAAFPHNSPNFVCYAALQGLARAVGVQRIVGVSARLQVCFEPTDIGHFDNAYDGFWRTVGGASDGRYGFELPVPWPTKELSQIPSKHRRRAAKRRVLLASVDDHAFLTVTGHLSATFSDSADRDRESRREATGPAAD
jgi:uncharacterized protein VirK/YbjX